MADGRRSARKAARTAGIITRIVLDPDGRPCVLLQVLGHAEWWTTLRPDDARAVAAALVVTADELDEVLARES